MSVGAESDSGSGLLLCDAVGRFMDISMVSLHTDLDSGVEGEQAEGDSSDSEPPFANSNEQLP